MRALVPDRGASGGGTPVVISGHNFDEVSEVRFGDVPATRFEVRSPTEIVAVSPAGTSGPVDVSVENPGGTSAHIVPKAVSRFVYVGGPGDIADLVARAISDSVIQLSFTSPGDGTNLGPATTYVVKQSATEIRDEASFAAATSLCEGGLCSFGRAVAAVLTVDGLEPDTTYHYAVRALGPLGELGNISNPASDTTSARGTGNGLGGRGSCPAVPEAVPGQLVFPGGKYSLVGLPGGTRVGANGPLYSWFDLGAGGSYSSQGGAEPVSEGRGYWAWFACPRLVDLPAVGTSEVNFPLGAYHASMVGNPSTGASQLTGHDFAAHWDPEANNGVGSYRISGYRDTQSLGVGQAAWVFSYEPTTIRVQAIG
ncbi:MAG TPA: IPT/TIG domain-containing protein [Acidimicrobiales bacterium]|nr:IPT/TIG domain-containing protein [Acidimicrobiales bacterium]